MKSKAEVSTAPAAPLPLLGPLEKVFHLLEDFFHSKTSISLSKGIVRALYTIYKNLKLVRFYSIGLCQFATDLKIRLVELKRRLENARMERLEDWKEDDKAMTTTPDPSLKKIFPLLDQTEKVTTTLQQFLATRPHLVHSLPPAIWQALQKMPNDLVLFPDYIGKQLNESKMLLQRIVNFYNQLAEAHRCLGDTDSDLHMDTSNPKICSV